MNSDLVARLRSASESGLDPYGLHCNVEKEAADRIEELEKHFQHAIAIFAAIRKEMYVVGEVMKAFGDE